MRDIFSPLNGHHVLSLFSELTQKWHKNQTETAESAQTTGELARKLHYYNFCLWHFEDEARRSDVAAVEIAQIKRNIDRFNQMRNDAIENLDIRIAADLEKNKVEVGKNAEMNSETPGSVVDRLSILSLKIYHMREETRRVDAEPDHLVIAEKRLAVLQEQSRDLVLALDRLLTDLVQGIKRHKIYRQFKMYNDPRFNPALYRKESQ